MENSSIAYTKTTLGELEKYDDEGEDVQEDDEEEQGAPEFWVKSKNNVIN